MKVQFRKVELLDIFLATLVLSFAFTMALTANYTYRVSINFFLFYFGISLVAVLTGFVGHEMLHKFAAFRYDYYAEFRRWNIGLLIAFLTGFFGIVFAAPGATNIYGYVDKNTNGKIAASGPVYNLVVGILLLYFANFFSGLVSSVLQFVAIINIWLSFFNLLPIPPLDGWKVFRWNFVLYIILLLISGFLTIKYVFAL